MVLASRLGGYSLWGLTPFLRTHRQVSLQLEPLVLADPLLQRLLVSVVVRMPGCNQDGARALQRHLLAPATQARIRASSPLDSDMPFHLARSGSAARAATARPMKCGVSEMAKCGSWSRASRQFSSVTPKVSSMISDRIHPGVSDTAVAGLGLEKPRTSVKFTLEVEGHPLERTLLLGHAAPGGFYASADRDPGVFVVPRRDRDEVDRRIPQRVSHVGLVGRPRLSEAGAQLRHGDQRRATPFGQGRHAQGRRPLLAAVSRRGAGAL